ncbi:DUF2855 family protein [Arenicella xantha]|uniref:Uncharacterized protein DUF2855 n=1 Tax=Arenicella xantha TaxID=644221 RepID=A0A395JQR6_9GAMM|nr:DUF2855 family protein [Arenicella xantha]RBP52796.1 uncharacterized protein DUF2855 [Arenicella xantha]
MQEFQTNKQDLSKSRIVEAPTFELAAGEARLKIDRFAFTANNITYAVLGDKLKYWHFFQPHGDNAEDWGIIPVWGFADVVESKCDDLPVGDRLFGYFLPSNELKVTPTAVSADRFIDASAHRSHLPPAYNMYRRVLSEPGYNKQYDDERMLLFVLHLTSYCIQDMLQQNNWFGAKQIVIISASSKTSTGLAYGLEADADAPTVVGLTSARNLDLVKSLGAYEQAYTYDNLGDIDPTLPTVVVDMSANTDVLSRLHTHLGDNMRFCSNVGLTHWEEPQQVAGINQERSQMFFAPGHIQQRIKELGAQEFDRRSIAYVMHTSAKSREWLKVKELDGVAGLAEVYADIANGKIPADEGLVVVM